VPKRSPTDDERSLASGMFTNVGRALSVLRMERGLSQGEVAERCRLGRPQLSRYETSKEHVRFDTLAKILHTLAVEPAQFFGLVISLDASLKLPPYRPGEAQASTVDNAFQNLHAAIDHLQQTIGQAFTTPSPGRSARAPAPPPTVTAPGDKATRPATQVLAPTTSASAPTRPVAEQDAVHG
jgi:transcriptional regulator with XRE-family HTH domain